MCVYGGLKVSYLKHSLVLMGMFRFKPARQLLEEYHGIVSHALNMEDLISNNLYKFRK
jgi:hypothetical protein